MTSISVHDDNCVPVFDFVPDGLQSQGQESRTRKWTFYSKYDSGKPIQHHFTGQKRMKGVYECVTKSLYCKADEKTERKRRFLQR